MNLLNTLFQLSLEGRFVIFLIMLPLFAWVCYVAFLSHTHLSNDNDLLQRLRQLTKTTDADNTLNDDETDEIANAIEKAPTHSLVKRVVNAVLNTRYINNPDLEAIMGLLFTSDASRVGAVRNVPNLLMLAGLLGTVFGLAGSVGGLSQQIGESLAQGNTEALSRSLLSTLKQMQGAFGATLWGIVLSLVAALLLGWVTHNRAQFGTQLQDFVLTNLVPATFPRSMEGQTERQARIIKQTSEVLMQFNKSLQSSAAEFNTVLGSTGQKVTESLTQLGAMTTTNQETLGKVLAGVDTLGKQLLEGANNLSAAQESSSKTFANAADNLERQLAGQAKEIKNLQATFFDSSNKMLEGISDVAKRLDNTVEAFRQQGTVQLEASERLRNQVDVRMERLEKLLPTDNNKG